MWSHIQWYIINTYTSVLNWLRFVLKTHIAFNTLPRIPKSIHHAHQNNTHQVDRRLVFLSCSNRGFGLPGSINRLAAFASQEIA